MCQTELSSYWLHYLLFERANSTGQGNDHIKYKQDFVIENLGSLVNQVNLAFPEI